MSLLGLETTLCAKYQKKNSNMTILKSCRPVVRNGCYTLWISSIPVKMQSNWNDIQSWCWRRPIELHNGWLLHFLVASYGPSLFFVCFYQLTASCKPVETARLENTTKLPPHLQHKSSFFYYHQIPVSQNKSTSCQDFPWGSSSLQRLLVGLKMFLPALHRNTWSIILCWNELTWERTEVPNLFGIIIAVLEWKFSIAVKINSEFYSA